MSQSLCKIYLHIIFHVKYSSPTIKHEDLDRVHSYIGGLINKMECQSLIVGGVEDHVHALVLLSSIESVSHLLEEMKRNSSRWIKSLSQHYTNFSWQGGYAALSVSQSLVDKTTNYIMNQIQHHKSVDFRTEYLDFLKLYKIDYNEKYLFSD